MELTHKMSIMSGTTVLLAGCNSSQIKIMGKNLTNAGAEVIQRCIADRNKPMDSSITHIAVEVLKCTTTDQGLTISPALFRRLIFALDSIDVPIAGIQVVSTEWHIACIRLNNRVPEDSYRVTIVAAEKTAVSALDIDPTAKHARNDVYSSSSSQIRFGAGDPMLLPTIGVDMCDTRIQSASMLEEGARAKVAAGSWNQALFQYNQHTAHADTDVIKKDKTKTEERRTSVLFNSTVEYPNIVLYHEGGLFVVRDLYPKAQVHLLVIASNELLSARCVKELSIKDLPVLQSMQKLGARLIAHFWDLSKGALTFLPLGFHSTPSLYPLHMHVISSDLDSQFLKKKGHFNSFTRIPHFFLPLDSVVHMIHADDGQAAPLAEHVQGVVLDRNMNLPLPNVEWDGLIGREEVELGDPRCPACGFRSQGARKLVKVRDHWETCTERKKQCREEMMISCVGGHLSTPTLRLVEE